MSLCLGLLLASACSSPGVRQRDPLLPLPVQRPEIEVRLDRPPSQVDDEHTVMLFRGRLSDRTELNRAESHRMRFARVSLEFLLEHKDLDPPEIDAPEEAPAALRLSAPYVNLPVLRMGELYQVRWEVSAGDPMGLPDTRLEIRDSDGRLIYVIASGAALPEVPLLEGLELHSARRAAFITDFDAGAGCRVRRRHYATRVGHLSLEAGDAWLMPTDQLELLTENGNWRLTVLDNSAALKGGCDKIMAQDLAHRTLVLQRLE